MEMACGPSFRQISVYKPLQIARRSKDICGRIAERKVGKVESGELKRRQIEVQWSREEHDLAFSPRVGCAFAG